MAAKSMQKKESSIERVFQRALIFSLLLHFFGSILINNIELPPPPTEAEYAQWVKKVAAPRTATVVPVEIPQAAVEKKQKVEAEEEAPSKSAKAAPSSSSSKAAPSEGRRQAVRSAVGNAGLLKVIGSSGEGGQFADIFADDSGAASADLGAAIDTSKGIGVAQAGAKIAREGGAGTSQQGGNGKGTRASDIGEVRGGGGGTVGTGTKAEGGVPHAMVGSEKIEALGGGIDVDGVRQVLRRRNSGFQRCYELGLKGNNRLRGKLVFELTIDTEGRVVKVDIINDQIKSREVLDCIESLLKRTRFPKAESGLVSIRSSLVFEANQ